ncbi:Glucose-regulated protein-like protein [Colletotrichum chlorophyti]|uniref:Glucose-regulated protein-like protein n=1 Tax=Colletotrichum chlorophyti TaxID=708187 RepID=A0A1Q8S582_9PEZI|nr:Glucose-regulated protein-like protein [Colletotrichum chlorophyti]
MTCTSTEPEYFIYRVIENPVAISNIPSDRGCVPNDTLPEILLQLKKTAESWVQEAVRYAVVSVPAHDDDEYRSAIRTAGEAVELDILRMFNASMTAIHGYGYDQGQDNLQDLNVLVYDLGRDIFEVSVTELDMGVYDRISVASNNRLAFEIGDMIKKKRRLDISSFDSTEMELFEQTLPYVDQVIQDANLTRSDIEQFLVIGDYTRTTQIRSMVENFFGGRHAAVPAYPSWKRPSCVDHDEAVTLGTALFAAIFAEPPFEDVLGAYQLQTRSLIVETIGGESSKMVSKWSLLPQRRVKKFTTATDYQSTVVFTVYQGEIPDARKNDVVVALRLSCIPPAPRGVPTIKLTLDVYEDEAARIRLNATARLEGIGEECFDHATALVNGLDGEENWDDSFDLEMFHAYKIVDAQNGVCVNDQHDLDQHYVTLKETIAG